MFNKVNCSSKIVFHEILSNLLLKMLVCVLLIHQFLFSNERLKILNLTKTGKYQSSTCITVLLLSFYINEGQYSFIKVHIWNLH